MGAGSPMLCPEPVSLWCQALALDIDSVALEGASSARALIHQVSGTQFPAALPNWATSFPNMCWERRHCPHFPAATALSAVWPVAS